MSGHCGHCKKQFTQKGHLKTHKDSVHRVLKYRCDECDYQVTREDSLKRHKQTKHNHPAWPTAPSFSQSYLFSNVSVCLTPCTTHSASPESLYSPPMDLVSWRNCRVKLLDADEQIDINLPKLKIYRVGRSISPCIFFQNREINLSVVLNFFSERLIIKTRKVLQCKISLTSIESHQISQTITSWLPKLKEYK